MYLPPSPLNHLSKSNCLHYQHSEVSLYSPIVVLPLKLRITHGWNHKIFRFDQHHPSPFKPSPQSSRLGFVRVSSSHSSNHVMLLVSSSIHCRWCRYPHWLWAKHNLNSFSFNTHLSTSSSPQNHFIMHEGAWPLVGALPMMGGRDGQGWAADSMGMFFSALAMFALMHHWR